MYHAFVFLFIFSSSKDKTDNYTNIIYNHVVLLRFFKLSYSEP